MALVLIDGIEGHHLYQGKHLGTDHSGASLVSHGSPGMGSHIRNEAVFSTTLILEQCTCRQLPLRPTTCASLHPSNSTVQLYPLKRRCFASLALWYMTGSRSHSPGHSYTLLCPGTPSDDVLSDAGCCKDSRCQEMDTDYFAEQCYVWSRPAHAGQGHWLLRTQML